MATFCERLRIIRKLNNVTLEKLAKDLGTTKATLSRYENGLRDPKSEVVNQLSEYFKVSSDYLLGNTDNPNKEKIEYNINNLDLDILYEELSKSNNEDIILISKITKHIHEKTPEGEIIKKICK